jgi:hypothetical protein
MVWSTRKGDYLQVPYLFHCVVPRHRSYRAIDFIMSLTTATCVEVFIEYEVCILWEFEVHFSHYSACLIL